MSWFDGAIDPINKRCGARGLININENLIIKWTFNCGCGTNIEEELLGAWETLSLAVRLNLDVLHVIRDSKIIIDWLMEKGRLQVASLFDYTDRINRLKLSFRKIHFTHVFKELNMEAHYLLKLALSKPEILVSYNY